MTDDSKDTSPRKRRILLTLIWLAVALLGWLLLFPAQSGLHEGTRVHADDKDTLTCDSVFFVGPSSSEARGGWDGDRVMSSQLDRKQLTHATCNAFRTQRVGVSVIVALALVGLLTRLPPRTSPPSEWGERDPFTDPAKPGPSPYPWPR